MFKFEKPRVLVLVATYNGEKYLQEQIFSILNQVNVNVDLLIRDDGSSDGTKKICESFSTNPQVSVMQFDSSTGTPAGCFYKLILGVKENFNFDYVAFSDQDDVWCSNKLNAAILKMGSNFDGYSSNLIAFDGDNSKAWIVNKSHPQTKYDYIFQGASAGCTYVLSRHAFMNVRRALISSDFSQLKKVSHDWLIYAIVRSAGMKWINDGSAYIFYRQHEQNSYGDKRGLKLILRKSKLIFSGWYVSQIKLIIGSINSNQEVSEIKVKIIHADFLKRLSNLYLLLKSRRRVQESLIVIFIFGIGLI